MGSVPSHFPCPHRSPGPAAWVPMTLWGDCDGGSSRGWRLPSPCAAAKTRRRCCPDLGWCLRGHVFRSLVAGGEGARVRARGHLGHTNQAGLRVDTFC